MAQLLPIDHAVAAVDGYTLYEARNFRMGGRAYKCKFPDGTIKDWTGLGSMGRAKPKAAPSGHRWRWLEPRNER